MQAGGDGDLQFLGELQHFRAGAGFHCTAADHENRLGGFGKFFECGFDIGIFRRGAERRIASVALFKRQVVVGFLVEHLAGVAAQFQMHRAGCTAGGIAKRLPQ